MKTILLLCFAFFSFGEIEAKTLLEQLYTINKDGQICFSSKTYSSAIDDAYKNLELETAGNVSYTSQGYNYCLKFYNFKEWAEEEPGFARRIEIYCNNSKILDFGDQDGWINFGDRQNISSVKNDKCLIFNLPDLDVIVLQTYPYESLPNITIIAIQKNIAKVVLYTSDYWVNSLIKTENEYFQINLKDDWGEDGPNPYIPKEYVIEATKEGLSLYRK